MKVFVVPTCAKWKYRFSRCRKLTRDLPIARSHHHATHAVHPPTSPHGVFPSPGVQALEKAGFKIVRQGKHIVMSDGSHFITIPRHNPVNALTMGGIVKDAGMSVEEFRNLL